MKRFLLFLALIITITFQAQAQAPQGFNYQATVRNSSGDLIVNTNVYFKFNVIQGSQTAVPIFTETHYVPTDDLGQVNLVIGQGTANTGAFSELDWSLGSYYLGIELDTGNGYLAMGTTQLLSVPYALYAENSGNSIPTTPNLQSILTENNSAGQQQIKDLLDPTDAQDAVTMLFLMEKISELQDQIDALQAATGSGTVTDQDGNTYNYLSYGDQVWTVENAEMVTYRDGTPIPQVTENTEWESLSTGAWAYYDNDPTKPRLYNWYAVMGIHDEASLLDASLRKEFAPEGWHVPTDAEWTTLEEHLIANGYNYDDTTTENKIAKAMASTTGWISSTETGAIGNDQSLNNDSGFNAFPEGNRNSNGSFINEGDNALFWSSSENTTNLAWYRNLFINYSFPYRSFNNKQIGFSVRFVQGEVDPNDADNDNDGYSVNLGDCDDNNAQVNPGTEDLIDGVDNNCDGVIDSQIDNISNLLTGASTNDDIGSSKTWYWQSDTDGFLGVGPPAEGGLYDIANPIWWSAPANISDRSCSYANEFVFTRTSGGVTFEQSGPVYFDGNYSDEFGITADNCYDESVVASIGGVKNVTFLASTSQAALQGSYGGTDFTKASMLFSDNGFMGWYVGHNLAQIEYEIILISENELVVRFVDSDSNLAWYSRFQTEPSVYNVDDDNDGYTENEGDCDDNDAQVNPGATEMEDGIDNDCDGEIDEGFDHTGISGTWRLAPEAGAIGVGPALNNVGWWSSDAGDATTRACLFDDEYVFGADGSFQNVVGADTWIEAWQGVAGEECGTPVAPHDGTATATYTYDEAAGSITLNGTGAYLGLAKVINGAELASPGDAPDSITYIAALSEDGNTLELDIEVAGGGHWSFKLARQ